MYTNPDAKLRLVIDARWFDEELPRGEPQRFGKASAARAFADYLAVFYSVVLCHPAGDVGG